MMVEQLLGGMTLPEKIGQMCVPILQQGEISPHIQKCIQEYHIGMLRYCPNAEYDGNSELVGEPNKFRRAEAHAEFINSIQRLAKIPLFIAVDQEGSIRNDVNRAGAFAYSGHLSFGAVDDVDLTYRVARATGEEFAAMGINLVQCPIVDVMTYSGRKTIKTASFGSDVELVCRHVLAMFKGFRDSGIAPMAKHFPGYGSVATDAHKGLAEITKSRDELEKVDIKPLRQLFELGLPGIMTGHVLTHAVDEEFPATLSKKMITGYLRGELGFKGMVETDAMRMPAIQQRYGTAEAALLAAEAGCDLILLRGDMAHFEAGYHALLDGAQSGRLAPELINAAVRRILTQKAAIGLLDHAQVDPRRAAQIIGAPAHKALAHELAQRSVSCFKRGILPLKNAGKVLTVCVEPQKIAAACDPEQSVDMLYQAVAPFFGGDKVLTHLQPTADETAQVLKQVPLYDTVIVGTCNALLYPSQADLVRQILQIKGENCIIVAMDSPYDYEVLGHLENYICTYGAAAASMQAAVEVMRGILPGTARPSVEINLA